MTETETGRERVAKILKSANVAVVTNRSDEFGLVSRPLALKESEFDGTLWFITDGTSAKADEIRKHSDVNVSVQDGTGFLSITGTAEIVHDRAKIDDLWGPLMEPWFEGGKDDPAVALLRVDTDTAEYWRVDEPKIVSAFKLAKSVITGEQPDLGKNDVVQL